MFSAYRNVALLSVCQGLLLTHGVSMIAVTGLAGRAVAPDAGLATAPLTAYVLGGAARRRDFRHPRRPAGRLLARRAALLDPLEALRSE